MLKENLYLQLGFEPRKSIDVYLSLAVLTDRVTIVTLARLLLAAAWEVGYSN
jgi:hypothetical protein